MRGRDKFLKYKKIINFLVKLYSIFSKKRRNKKLIKARNKRGVWGIVKRYALLKSLCKSCGDNVLIGEGVYLFGVENMSIGDNVSIHPMSYIDATGGLTIGNDVSIAHGTTIMTTSHKYEEKDVPIKDQDYIVENVEIANNVWIGAKATILCGIKIEEGSVVGANAVVTKNVEKGNIVAGVPAKVIKTR